MRRCSALVLTGLLGVASLCVPVYSAPSDTVVVQLISVSVEQMLSAETFEEFDTLLYPSGMALPTKYLDFLMFSDLGLDGISMSSSTYEFMCTNFPTEDGKYTAAECYTAQMYCGFNRVVENEDSFDKAEVAAVHLLDSDLGLDLSEGSTSNQVLNLELLQADIEKYRTALDVNNNTERVSLSAVPEYEELTTVAPDGIQRSLGLEGIAKCDTATPRVGLENQILVNFSSTMGEYMDTYGVTVYNRLASNGKTVQPPTTSAAGSIDNIQSGVTAEEPEFKASVDIGTYNITGVTDKEYSIHDILVIVSLVVVVLSAVVFGVLDWKKRRNDPARRWKR